jgi:putative intracellular protease/amidase
VLSTVSASGFDAVFFPGGHGPLWDLSENADSIKLIETFAANDRPIAAVCHAPAVFKHPKGADGKPLVSGRTVTGFTNTEEEAAGLTDVVPFLVEDMLKAKGGVYEKGADWASFGRGIDRGNRRHAAPFKSSGNAWRRHAFLPGDGNEADGRHYHLMRSPDARKSSRKQHLNS